MPRPPVSRARRPSPPPPGSENWLKPWVQIKYFTFHPNIYPNMISAASADATRGSVVTVYDREGKPFAQGFYNAQARVPLRLFKHGQDALPEDHFDKALEEAVDLRLNTLRLQEHTDAFRVVHSDADAIPGLMVDKFGDTLSVEVSNAAAFQRLENWIPKLHALLGTCRHVVSFDTPAVRAENLPLPMVRDELQALTNADKAVKISEHGMRFLVDFEQGHKTGFFCDQRENRAKWGAWTKGKKVLDVCCYTGGFSIAAKLGGASEVTGVDLDEKAIEQAKKNANLNQQRISFVHADAFSWMRQMQKNGTTWEAVILDPPKLVLSRESFEEGKAKYHDLNKLAISLVERGGLFATCSCSGLMPTEVFEELVIGIAHRSGRKLQILDRTGAGADHPVMSNCPESRYLKVLWARVY